MRTTSIKCAMLVAAVIVSLNGVACAAEFQTRAFPADRYSIGFPASWSENEIEAPDGTLVRMFADTNSKAGAGYCQVQVQETRKKQLPATAEYFTVLPARDGRLTRSDSPSSAARGTMAFAPWDFACTRVRAATKSDTETIGGLPGISGSTVAAPAAGAVGSIAKALKAFAKRDYGAAGRLFFPLAEKGNAVAQLHLGKMSESGLGVPANQAEAAKWYAMAAELGEPTAQYNLALMDEVGTHALWNPDQRGALIRSAANAGHADAQFKLACGLVDSEPVRAAAWFLIAARNGTSWRRDRCATLDLSPDDGRAAAELAQRCYESKYVDCAVAAEKAPIHAVTPTAAGVTKTAGAMPMTDDSRTSLGSAALLALVQVTVRFGLAFATYTALTFGVGKPRSRPTQHGRWVGAWGAALAVASARTNVDLPETIIGTLVMAVTLFACGFISGYIWRRFRPIRSLDAAGRAT